MEEIQLVVEAGPNGTTRLSLRNNKRWRRTKLWVDMDRTQVEMVAMNLLSRTILDD